ncbi:unnamed protein product, partial [Brenthis ino]
MREYIKNCFANEREGNKKEEERRQYCLNVATLHTKPVILRRESGQQIAIVEARFRRFALMYRDTLQVRRELLKNLVYGYSLLIDIGF